MRVIRLAVTLAGVILAGTAFAQTVVDQGGNTSPFSGFSYLNSGYVTEQTFASDYGNIVGASIYLDSGYDAPPSGHLTAQLWSGTANQASAILLASGTITATSGAWNDVFWDKVDLALGGSYSLRFSSDTFLVSDFSVFDSYVGGSVWYDGISYASAGWDLAFKTYADAGTGAVPEPASWMMLLGGFGLVGGAMRSRLKARLSLR